MVSLCCLTIQLLTALESASMVVSASTANAAAGPASVAPTVMLRVIINFQPLIRLSLL